MSGAKSDYLLVTRGVPQGLFFGLVLISVCISDLPRYVDSSVGLFAMIARY